MCRKVCGELVAGPASTPYIVVNKLSYFKLITKGGPGSRSNVGLTDRLETESNEEIHEWFSMPCLERSVRTSLSWDECKTGVSLKTKTEISIM